MGIKCPKCQTNNPDTQKFCGECGTQLSPSEEVSPSLTKTLETPMKGLTKGDTVAGRYEVVEELGRGGMGVVYKAKDTKLKRTVALKFLPPELAGNKEAKERFIREAQAAASLDHPNICTIHEVDESDGKTFISMAYVDGQSLREKLKTGPLDVQEGLNLAIQAAEGLAAAHTKGVVHRDIKSSNIMVTKSGQAKIMDFGLAKFTGVSLITRKGVIMGTVAYMSPEQAQGKVVDHRSDIWSLGVVLYEMFGGKLPFQGETEASFLYSIVHEEPKALKETNPDVPIEIQKIINRTLRKKPESRYQSADEMATNLKHYQDQVKAEESGLFNLRTLLRRLRQPKVAIPAALALALIAAATIWFFNRQAKIRWAKEEALPEIERLVEASWLDFVEAYKLAEKAEKYIANAPKLSELLSKCSLKISVKTEPPGAKIYSKEYKFPDNEWNYLGVSPIENIRVPIGVFRWKIEKEGYETVMGASSTYDIDMKTRELYVPYDLVRMLDKKEKIPLGMVRVKGSETSLGKLDDFFIDKYEVTNKQYKEFINNGGYRNRHYWKLEFIKDGRVLTWEQAMAEFVDQTGRPGPSTWRAGDYPEGEDYPVSGISWYEAKAYAEFVGKSLPTGYHWDIARGEYTPTVSWRLFFFVLIPMSNFKGEGPVPVGSYQGMTSYGAYDMAGNVREWCWNETQKGRLIRGGAWNDSPNTIGYWSQAPPFDRSSKNGLRCALYPDPDKIPKSAFQLAKFGEIRDFYKEEPIPDSIFQVYKEQFSYDKTELNAHAEWKDESHEDWIQEKITFDAAYEGEQIIAYLFLPKNTLPPYQTVIYFPRYSSFIQKSSKDLDSYWEFEQFLSFIVKNGRAVLYPVYKGTFERKYEIPPPNTHQYTEYNIQVIKDLKKCIDYLETRSDINSNKLAYYGMSWGGVYGAIIPAVEERLKTNVLVVGGLLGIGRPQINAMNYITRVKTPTLMLNGKYDMVYPYEITVKPMFDLLGTPDEHKELKLYETDHFIPINELIKETLAWLDKYLGPVE